MTAGDGTVPVDYDTDNDSSNPADEARWAVLEKAMLLPPPQNYPLLLAHFSA